MTPRPATRDVTLAAYTCEHDAQAIRAKQARLYGEAMDALLARHDAGETLSSTAYSALFAHFVGSN